MSLVTGHGPLSSNPLGWFTPTLPVGAVLVEPHPRRIQAFRDGVAVINTENALLVHRADRPLSYAFPAGEVGELPGEPLPEAAGFVTVPWDAVDMWLEEGRQLVHYPPNPYHRVDCLPSRRALRASVGDTALVDTDDTVIVFETSLQPRLYVNPAQVRTDLLRRSTTTSYCNYKGVATYWSFVPADGAGEVLLEDVAWSYHDPLPESAPITGYLSFDPTRVDVLAELPGPTGASACGCEA